MKLMRWLKTKLTPEGVWYHTSLPFVAKCLLYPSALACYFAFLDAYLWGIGDYWGAAFWCTLHLLLRLTSDWKKEINRLNAAVDAWSAASTVTIPMGTQLTGEDGKVYVTQVEGRLVTFQGVDLIAFRRVRDEACGSNKETKDLH